MLCLVSVFNRKRIGEIQFLNIQTYARDSSNINQEECFNSPTDLEKNMSNFFKRVVVLGKGSKPVPILFTRQMRIYLKMLLEIRTDTNLIKNQINISSTILGHQIDGYQPLLYSVNLLKSVERNSPNS